MKEAEYPNNYVLKCLKVASELLNITQIMTKEYWMGTQLSLAKHYGRIDINGKRFVVVNQFGLTLHETSIGNNESADLIDEKYLKYYKHFGRDKFITFVKNGYILKDFEKEYKLSKIKQIKRAVDNKQGSIF